jgi:hypothetical protein
MNPIKLLITALAFTLSSVSWAAPAHDYELNGSFNDALGGPALVTGGGTLGADGYTFGVSQGLALSNALTDGADYSIEIRFSFDANQTTNNSTWLKIIDFKNLTSDDGLYSYLSAGARTLDYCVCGTQHNGTADVFSGGKLVDVLLTRDKTTQMVKGYANGVEQFSFVDVTGSAVFSSSDKVIHFVRDDNAVMGEASSGFVDRIRIYNGAIAPVPEPETYAMLLAGLGLMSTVARRRGKYKA